MVRVWSNKQVRIAISELEDAFPGAIAQIKQAIRINNPGSDEAKDLFDQSLKAMNKVFSKLPFIAKSSDPRRAKHNLTTAVYHVVRVELGLLRKKDH